MITYNDCLIQSIKDKMNIRVWIEDGGCKLGDHIMAKSANQRWAYRVIEITEEKLPAEEISGEKYPVDSFNLTTKKEIKSILIDIGK